MEKDEEYDSKEIIEFLDKLKENEVTEENWLSYDPKDLDYLSCFDSLNTIKLIKSNPDYYLSKWRIIVNNLINFNDFIFRLKDRYNLSEKGQIYLLSKCKKENKSNNSSDYSSISEDTSSNNSNNIIIDNYNYSPSCNEPDKNGLSQTKIDLYEFKLKYMNQYLNFGENEKMDWESFKKYAKKTLYTMLLLLKIDCYEFLNPKNILFYKIKEILQSKQKFLFQEIEEESFEIDNLINKFAINDFKKLLNKFPNRFFLLINLN